MKKTVETFYKLNDREKIILKEKYMKSDSNNNYPKNKEFEYELPNVKKVDETPLPEIVVKYSIANAKMMIEPSSFVYDGMEKRPAITVKDRNKILSPDNYDIAYASNIAVGTGIVTVTGKNNYKGTLSGTFEIKKSNTPLFAWILAALILTVAVGCGIIFLSGDSSDKKTVTSSASQISEITSESVISTVSSKTVSDKSENSVKTSSHESSIESSEEISVNSQESSFDVTSVEEPHQPSVESAQPSVILESSVYVSSQQSSEIIPVQESSEIVPVQESSKENSIGKPGDLLTQGTCGENLKYTFNNVNNTLTITGTGDMFDNFEDFQSNHSIKTILIGSNVTSICNNAFESCEKLETVKMADDIKTIGTSVFLNCISLKEVHLSKNLEKLSSYAFNGCNSLEEITIPDTITKIYKNTFENCIALKSVHLSQNIIQINENAFTGCDTGILTIYAPKGSYAETYAKEYNIKFEAEGTAIT